jgi:type IX secretion system PorP/SprF family membrane protein
MCFKIIYSNHRLKYTFAFVWSALVGTTHAQVTRFPVQYSQFFNSYSIINPASCGQLGDLEIQIGRQQHGGAWKNIATTFTTGTCRIKKSKANNFHVTGISFMRDKEGEYLKQSRVYVVYAWHTKLTKKVSLSAGLTSGFFSYLIAGSNANVTSAATAFDGSLGLWLYTNNYYIGASTNQITNSELTPLEETTKLVRHYNVTGGFTQTINKNLTVTPRVLLRYCPGFPLDLDVSVGTSIKELVVLGINYRYNKSIVPYVGFEKVKLGNGNLRTMFSYAVPNGKTVNNIQTYEVTLNYNHQSKKKNKK